MPGEEPAVFGDALRRLASSATYLYQDGPRYWYSTQPTVTKLAEDRAEQLKRNPDAIVRELDKRLKVDLRAGGDFTRIHQFPQSGSDVQDDLDARLVVLGVDHPYSKEAGNAAELAAKEMLETRGNAPRLYRNSLVFLAVDKTKLQDLDEAVRRYLAWESIVSEANSLELAPSQVKQAETQKDSANGAVTARIPEAYQWLLVPVQSTPQSDVQWQAMRLTGSDALAVRASKKLRNDELLLTAFAPSRLRMELDRVPLWRGQHVAIRQLIEDFPKYIYLPRLQTTQVLMASIQDGLNLMTWGRDSFAYADSYDESAERYRGLVGGRMVSLGSGSPSGLLVQPETALKQIEAETPQPAPGGTSPGTGSGGTSPGTGGRRGEDPDPTPTPKKQPTRFYGSVTLDASRVGRDERIADEVLSTYPGSLVPGEGDSRSRSDRAERCRR